MPNPVPQSRSLSDAAYRLAETLTSNLEQQGFRHDPAATLTIVLDSPRGFAPYTLASIGTSALHLIAVTWSFCPEYWQGTSAPTC
jgi:hypothetical protein